MQILLYLIRCSRVAAVSRKTRVVYGYLNVVNVLLSQEAELYASSQGEISSLNSLHALF